MKLHPIVPPPNGEEEEQQQQGRHHRLQNNNEDDEREELAATADDTEMGGKRSVSFGTSSSVRVAFVSTTVAEEEEVSDEEIRSMCYGEDELDEIKMDIARTVRAARKKENGDGSEANGSEDNDDDNHGEDDEHCTTRGLETFLSTATLRRSKAAKRLATDAVLREQDRQKFQEIYDPERMRKVSVRSSAESVRRAYSRGKADAACVVRSLGVPKADNPGNLRLRERRSPSGSSRAQYLRETLESALLLSADSLTMMNNEDWPVATSSNDRRGGREAELSLRRVIARGYERQEQMFRQSTTSTK